MMNPVFKLHEVTINVSAQARNPQVIQTGTEFWSYDVRSGKSVINFVKDGNPLPLTHATNVQLLFYFVADASEMRLDLSSGVTMDDAENGKVSVILPNYKYDYTGFVFIYTYIDFENGQSFDAGVLETRFERSKIDQNLEEMQSVYVGRFEDLIRLIQERVDEIEPTLSVTEDRANLVSQKVSEIWASIEDFRGPQGNAATVSVGSVNHGASASVVNVGTNNDAVFDFVLPRGEQGEKGEDGDRGIDGRSGIIVSTTAPPNPEINQLWQTASGQTVQLWNGTSWVAHTIGETPPTVADNLTTTVAGSVLDARQGRILNERITEESGILSDEITLLGTELSADIATLNENLSNRGVSRLLTSEATTGNIAQGTWTNNHDPLTVGVLQPGTYLITVNQRYDGGASGNIVTAELTIAHGPVTTERLTIPLHQTALPDVSVTRVVTISAPVETFLHVRSWASVATRHSRNARYTVTRLG